MVSWQSGGDGGWSRRRFVGALAVAGGGALLAACGGTVPTATPLATVVAPTATAGQATTPTAVAGSPTRPGPPSTPATPLGTPGTPGGTPAGTPTRPGSPVAATPTPRANPVLNRLLASVPQREPLPGKEGIWYADVATQKRNYGFAGVTSQEAYDRLTEGQRLTFANVIAAVPVPNLVGFNFARQAEWREATGYDFWQVDRTIYAGDLPDIWARMEGRFDRAEIARVLGEAGHQPVPYREGTILARGEDYQVVNIREPIGRLTLARLNRVVLEEGALAAAQQTALAEAGIDVRAGRVPSFAADPDFAALMYGLGPVVGAILSKPDNFWGTPNPSARPTQTPTPSRTVTPAAERLPRYSHVGLGLRDDGKDHAMVIALVYRDLAEARTAAAVLLRRLESYRLTVSGQQLSERAEPGDAEIVTAGDRFVVVTPLKISDEPSLSLWLRMYGNRDYRFLAE